MLEAEVQRINTTTRAPDMLAEIKAALGNDPAKFARAVAKPFLVERLLRGKFDNDDALHATQRRQAEAVREKLLAQDPNPEGERPREPKYLRKTGLAGTLALPIEWPRWWPCSKPAIATRFPKPPGNWARARPTQCPGPGRAGDQEALRPERPGDLLAARGREGPEGILRGPAAADSSRSCACNSASPAT